MTIAALLCPLLLVFPTAQAQGPRFEHRSLGGGAEAGARLELEKALDGRPGAFVFRDLPTGAATIMIMSWRQSELELPFVAGEIRADPVAPGAGVFAVASRLPMREVTTFLTDHPLVIQGLVIHAAGWHVTDAVEIRYRLPAEDTIVSRAERFPRFVPGGGIAAIAHKGNTGSAPENTPEAIDAAFAAGATYVEVDVRLSADGVAVLMHDWTLERTTQGSGFVSAKTMEELAVLGVPTLAAGLRAARGRGRLLLDVKESHAAGAIRSAMREAGVGPEALWIYVYASRIAVLEFHAELPAVPLVWGLVPAQWDDAFFERMRDLGVVGFDVEWTTLPAGFVGAAHGHGMFVFTYTVNGPELVRAIASGVDGIETDELPRLVALLLEARGSGRWMWWAGGAALLGLLALTLLRRQRPSPGASACSP